MIVCPVLFCEQMTRLVVPEHVSKQHASVMHVCLSMQRWQCISQQQQQQQRRRQRRRQQLEQYINTTSHLLDSHGFLKQASEGDDAGLKRRPLLGVCMPAGLHEVQVCRQAREGTPRQLRLGRNGGAPLLLCYSHHNLQGHVEDVKTRAAEQGERSQQRHSVET